MSKNKIIYLCLALLLVIGFWLRVYQINQVLFSGQEITYLNAAAGLYHSGHFEVWNFQDQQTIRPFLGDKIYTAQITLSYLIFGLSEFSTRLPSVLWGLILIIGIYFFSYNLSKDKLISLFLVFCLVFSNVFIEASRLADPAIMYASLFFLGINLLFLKHKFLKIIGSLIIALSFIVSLLYFDINLPRFDDIGPRYDDFFTQIFKDFRIVWLVSVPAIVYLLETKWWKSKKYLVAIIFIIITSIVIPVITENYDYQNYYFLVVLPFFWFFVISGIKHITRHKKEYIFILITLVLTVVPSFPLILGLKPLTHDFIIQQTNEKERALALYQYLDENKLDKTHLISPVDFYLKDYSFAYQKHSSVEKYKVDNIENYLQQDSTGYLIFPKELEIKISNQKIQRIKTSFIYHQEISYITEYEVFSWGPEEAEKFINYEN